MSTSTKTRTTAVTRTKRPRVVHSFCVFDIEFSEATGLQVKALCGRWQQVKRDRKGGGDGPLPEGWRHCKTCQRIRNSWYD